MTGEIDLIDLGVEDQVDHYFIRRRDIRERLEKLRDRCFNTQHHCYCHRVNMIMEDFDGREEPLGLTEVEINKLNEIDKIVPGSAGR